MIQIKRKTECCGCSACVERCPKQCISFDEDSEGFRFPKVDVSKCIECGLCEKVCPVINPLAKKDIVKVYAAKVKDEIVVLNSSSGGVFTYLAEQVLDDKGVVFGARFDENWEVKHDYCESKEDLKPFRTSKYVQSHIGNSYRKCEEFLKLGRKVMFTGTPCQIAGLWKFLHKDYPNLLAVDVICHGVPSPGIWRKYLKQLVASNGETVKDIKYINHREKNKGWRDYGCLIETKAHKIFSSHIENPYMRAFNMNVILRSICYECPFKDGKSNSDITIGDFWGIEKVDSEFSDNKGLSMIIMHVDKDVDFSGLKIKEEDISTVAKCNGSYFHCADYNGNRTVFFAKFPRTKNIVGLFDRCTRPTTLQRVGNVICRKLHK